MNSETIPQFEVIDLFPEYQPSVPAWNFHNSTSRFKYLVWGVKSGKTMAGAWEFCRWVFENPGIWGMVVGPTNRHTDVAWSEVLNILNYWEGLIVRCNSNRREISLVNGSKIDFRTGDRPDNLRGPNVDIMWVDEGGFLKRDSWVVLRSRVSATHGNIFITTTLDRKNWLWSELIKGGMPADAPFGEWTVGERFVSHYPTAHFPWVDPAEIEAVRLDLSKAEFEREFLCMIIGSDSEVFRHVEEALSWEDPPLTIDGQTVMGVDLAKFQDFTAVVVMQHDGRVIHVDHWSETDWTIQRPRLIELSERWKSVVILDRSHVGSVIEDDLKSEGVYVHPIDLNDAHKKREIIEGLQITFERRGIKIPDYRAPWTTLAHQKLHDELKNYQHSLTRTGRVSYSAPEGLHDDLVIALALANWGRAKGQAGGVGQVTEAYGSKKPRGPSIRNPARQARSKMYKKVYGNRRSITGLPSGGSFWGR